MLITHYGDLCALDLGSTRQILSMEELLDAVEFSEAEEASISEQSDPEGMY
jgi:hypothetical protein